MKEKQLSLKPITQGMKRKLAAHWDELRNIRYAHEANGAVVAQKKAAALLAVSPQRIGQLIDSGRLQSVDIGGFPVVTLQSVIEYGISPRNPGGRPRKKTA